MNKSNKQKIVNVDYKTFTIDPVDIAFGSNVILKETKLTIKYGEHYCLIGKNGIGKSSLLTALFERKINVPERLDMVYVRQEESVTSDKTVLATLLDADPELNNKQKKLDEYELKLENDNITDDELEIYQILSDELENSGTLAKNRAQKILFGLGFTHNDLSRFVKEFSGGWRMRISLASALYMTPTLLILDEPTNHLDLHANLWLTNYLKTYPKTLLVVSHDQYFIDEISTMIISIDNHKLNYYNGNYDKYSKQFKIDRDRMLKDWKLYEKRLNEMKKENKDRKALDEYIKKNFVARPEKDYDVKIKFMEPNAIKGFLIRLDDVSFSYGSHNDDKNMFNNIDFEITQTRRIAIVGKNGVGKSTFLKLLLKDIEPISGQVYHNPVVKIGYYNQHFEEDMPMDITSIEYLMSLNNNVSLEQSHEYLSLFGLDPKHRKVKICELSGGQKARVKFASFGVIKPHVLILDEPSNHLDIVALNSLIEAINSYTGAIILVSHNFDLITKINSELLIIEDLHDVINEQENIIISLSGEKQIFNKEENKQTKQNKQKYRGARLRYFEGDYEDYINDILSELDV